MIPRAVSGQRAPNRSDLVLLSSPKITTETQRTQRLHREVSRTSQNGRLSTLNCNRSLRGAEEGGEPQEIREHAAGGYFRAGAWASDDHRLGVVACRLEAHDVVAAR